jgi:hypothetical protein
VKEEGGDFVVGEKVHLGRKIQTEFQMSKLKFQAVEEDLND